MAYLKPDRGAMLVLVLRVVVVQQVAQNVSTLSRGLRRRAFEPASRSFTRKVPTLEDEAEELCQPLTHTVRVLRESSASKLARIRTPQRLAMVVIRRQAGALRSNLRHLVDVGRDACGFLCRSAQRALIQMAAVTSDSSFEIEVFIRCQHRRKRVAARVFGVLPQVHSSTQSDGFAQRHKVDQQRISFHNAIPFGCRHIRAPPRFPAKA